MHASSEIVHCKKREAKLDESKGKKSVGTELLCGFPMLEGDL
jgi:hypothetical protein